MIYLLITFIHLDDPYRSHESKRKVQDRIEARSEEKCIKPSASRALTGKYFGFVDIAKNGSKHHV